MVEKKRNHGDTETRRLHGDFTEASRRAQGVAGTATHRVLRPGLLESAYEACLCREFELRGLKLTRQTGLPLEYKGINLDCGYRTDIVVEGRVLVEVKAIESVAAVHEAQLLTYLRLTGCRVGLILNFFVPIMKQGIIRRVL
ncbi:MAG: GxxExxY protein [Planctomycetes bacterium]|nr:GxxExxY protein [Planctomycetota bacterium]